MDKIWNESRSMFSKYNQYASIEVHQGSLEKKKPIYKLSLNNKHKINLLVPNLLKLRINAEVGLERAPLILLKKPVSKEVFQTFQMLLVDEEYKSKITESYQLTFAVNQNLDVYIPRLSTSEPVAHLFVSERPVPQVTLRPLKVITDPWSDDKPLPLKIDVLSQNPLQTINLLIRTGSKESKELVNRIAVDDMKNFTTNYDLLLEPYLQEDLAQVEVVAQAVDRSNPNPLIGYSQAIRLNTASAYGRYKQSLQKLREIKTILDQAITKKKPDLPADNIETLSKDLLEKSESTPFFDGLDRVQIHNFDRSLKNILKNPMLDKVYDISSKINEFLEEHEILDDRERDRDFFVAARGLSRVIERDKKDRDVSVDYVSKQIINFLKQRHKRWDFQVLFFDMSHPISKKWNKILSKKPFQNSIEKIANLDLQENKTNEMLTILSQTVADYREWITELETAEDAKRKQLEEKRRQGLASAQNKLRELQKQQGQISSILDKASEQPVEGLKESWPIARMKQNTNIKETTQLEASMRMLSPNAAYRVQAAIKAMKATLKSGNDNSFVQAESASDLAGRLLRKALKSSMQKQKRRKRRRRGKW